MCHHATRIASILKPLISPIKAFFQFPLAEKLSWGLDFILDAFPLSCTQSRPCVSPLCALGSYSLYDCKSFSNPCLLVLLYPVPELEGTNTDLKDQSKAFEWVTNSLFSSHQLFPGLRLRLHEKKSLPHLAEAKPNFNNSIIGPFFFS